MVPHTITDRKCPEAVTINILMLSSYCLLLDCGSPVN